MASNEWGELIAALNLLASIAMCESEEHAKADECTDIFTLARDRGAVSALLYTTTSSSCLLNQHYIQDFEKPLDVFATKTVQVAR